MASKTGYSAYARFLFGSPSKVRPVADLVRRKSYTDALAILDHVPNKGAGLIRKVVMSAVANALSLNKKLDEDMLFVKELKIDEGPRLKRVWCRSKGRGDMLLKRMCHISVVVEEIRKSEAQGGK